MRAPLAPLDPSTPPASLVVLSDYLVFATKGAADFVDVKALAQALVARGDKVQFVDRMSSRLSDLLLVAQYGVVEPTVVIGRHHTKVVLRLTTHARLAGLPTSARPR